MNSEKNRNSLGAAAVVAAILVLGAAPGATAQNQCNVTWDVNYTQLGVHASGGIAGLEGGTSGGGHSAVDLVDGALPPDMFDDDVAVWDAGIAGLWFLTDDEKATLTAQVSGFYDDLSSGLNDSLAALPSRVVMQRTRGQNWLEALFQVIPVRTTYVMSGGNVTQYHHTNYQCHFVAGGFLGGDGAFDNGWLAATVAPWFYAGQPNWGNGNFSVDALFLGAVEDLFIVTFDIGVDGRFTLTPL